MFLDLINYAAAFSLLPLVFIVYPSLRFDARRYEFVWTKIGFIRLKRSRELKESGHADPICCFAKDFRQETPACPRVCCTVFLGFVTTGT